jgi:hypothetical protein
VPRPRVQSYLLFVVIDSTHTPIPPTPTLYSRTTMDTPRNSCHTPRTRTNNNKPRSSVSLRVASGTSWTCKTCGYQQHQVDRNGRQLTGSIHYNPTLELYTQCSTMTMTLPNNIIPGPQAGKHRRSDGHDPMQQQPRVCQSRYSWLRRLNAKSCRHGRRVARRWWEHRHRCILMTRSTAPGACDLGTSIFHQAGRCMGPHILRLGRTGVIFG